MTEARQKKARDIMKSFSPNMKKEEKPSKDKGVDIGGFFKNLFKSKLGDKLGKSLKSKRNK